jgi:gliding motility-associated-like protein
MCCTYSYAHSLPVDEVQKNGIKLIENKGQWDSHILFRAHIPGGALFVTKTGLVYSLIDEKNLHEAMHHPNGPITVKGHNYRVNFTGANVPQVGKQDPSSEYYNFFKGSNPAKWASECRAWGKVTLLNLYNGIDMEIVALNERLKINFIVKPLADIRQIKLTYEGVDRMQLINQYMMIETQVAAVKESQPVAFQPALHKNEIAANYILQNNELSFQCADFNPLFPLIIDPEIIFGTYSGSVADNFGFTATYDLQGNGYAGGTVYDFNFPTTMGSFQATFQGGANGSDNTPPRDCGILKFSANGQNLLYCTYLGGSHNEQPHSMICAPNGELVIYGTTHSNDFPTLSNSYDNTYNGGYDIFITRLNASGTGIVGSTYFGGTNDDGINGNPNYSSYNATNAPLKYNFGDQYRGEVNFDRFGNIIIASCTRSGSGQFFPLQGGFQNTFGGQQDGVLARFSSNLSVLSFSTYLGGNGHDAAYGVVCDPLNNYYVTGGTTSNNLTPSNAFFSYKGGVDAFVAQVTPAGNSLTKFIYLGTNMYDQSYFIQLDDDRNVYITGQTESTLFPIRGVTVPMVGGGKQFVSIFNSTLDTLKVSNTFGKTDAKPCLTPSAFLVNICRRIYVSGWGGQTNQTSQFDLGNTTGLPVTVDAFQKNTDGSDFYLAVFSPMMKDMVYATFIGDLNNPDHVDGGTSRFDPSSVVYQSVCAGCNNGTTGFPTTANAWSRVNKGVRPGGNGIGCNNALFKMSLNVSMYGPEMKDTILTVLAGDSLTYTATITDLDADEIATEWDGTFAFAQPNMPAILLLKQKGTNRLLLGWRSTCANAGDTLLLKVMSTDNACPMARFDTSYIRVAVLPKPLPPPPFPECLQTAGENIANLKWSISQSTSARGYKLYRSVAGGNDSLMATFPSRFFTSFTDTAAYNHLLVNHCYYLKAYNECNEESVSSRVVCSIFKEDTVTDPGFHIPKDTILYIYATDTLHANIPVFDTDAKDSVYLLISGGTLRNNPQKYSTGITNGLGAANLQFSFIAICSDVSRADTLDLNLIIYDNQCPTPRSAQGKVKVVVLPPPAGPGPGFRCIKKVDNNQVKLTWPQASVNKYFSHFEVLRKNPDGSIEVIGRSNGNEEFELSTPATGNENINYCYAAYSVSVCGNNGDTSPWSCTVRKPEDYPFALRILTVTVEDNKNIRIIWQKSNDVNFEGYNLYKRMHSLGPEFNPIMSRADASNAEYLDESVDVAKNRYCYQLRQLNVCGLESQQNQEACSILLKGVAEPFVNKLEWTPYSYWLQGVSRYTLERTEPDVSPFNAGFTNGNSTAWNDENLNYDNGIYYYTVTATENDPHAAYTSRSNTIELIQKPILHVPNAFTPNGDGNNDDWRPRPVFVKDYELRIYNRWGQLVFETNTKYDYFNGSKANDKLADDAYVYLIKYTGWDGSVHERKGNVTLLR